MILQALEQLRPGCNVQVKYNDDGTYDVLSYEHPEQQPNEQELNSKLVELRKLEPMRLLREERNRRIALTDWRFRSDLSPSQEWMDYCVALRDLPANYSPTIDILTEDEYPLVKEDNTTPWPEEPSDG